MPLQNIYLRIPDDDKAHLKALAADNGTSMGIALSNLIAKSTVQTLALALQRRIESGVAPIHKAKSSNLLVAPESLEKIRLWVETTMISSDMLVRLIIEADRV